MDLQQGGVLDMGEGSPGDDFEGIVLEVSGGVVQLEAQVPDDHQTQSASIRLLEDSVEAGGEDDGAGPPEEAEGRKADPEPGDDTVTAEAGGGSASNSADDGAEEKVKVVGDDDDKVAGTLASYFKMLDMVENQDVIYADVAAECPICFISLPPGEGIVLRECLHIFCKECLINVVQFDDSSATVNCPYRDAVYACEFTLQQREIKGIVPPELFEQYLARSVKLAENRNPDSFHCKTPDCGGWCEFEKSQNVTVFVCPVCTKDNCLTCEAIHEGMVCMDYQRELAKNEPPETDGKAKKSLKKIKGMIESGEALHCPSCNIVITKPEGCDGVTCTRCKTEICWATKGFRWGKDGKGDNSGGCKCNVGGVKCHPNCQNCH